MDKYYGEGSLNRILKCFVALGLLAVLQFGYSTAEAQDATAGGIVIFPSFSIRDETGIVGGSQSNYRWDIRAGYVTDYGLYLGMIHSQTVSSGSDAINQTAIGNTMGFYYGPASLMFSYFMMVSHAETGENYSARRSEGSGFQFDLSYTFPIWSLVPTLTFGPMLTYKSHTFHKLEVDGLIRSDVHTERYIHPYIGLKLVW